MNDSVIMADMVESTDKFGAKLACAVKRWSGSQRDLAAKVGVSPQMLYQYMKGSVPKPHVLLLLSKELKVPLSWLMNENDDSLDPPESGVASALQDAKDEAIFAELQRRYNASATVLYKALDGADNVAWEHIAIWVLWHGLNGGPDHPVNKPSPDTLPDLIFTAIKLAEFIFGTFEFCTLYATADVGTFHASPTPLLRASGVRIDAKELLFEKLEAKVHQLADGHPGIAALYEYLIRVPHNFVDGQPRQYSPETLRELDLEGFWTGEVPRLLAGMMNHEHTIGKSQYDHIRVFLQGKGYLDAKGKPMRAEAFKLKKPPKTD